MANNNSGSANGCKCLPYKDSALITAQGLAIVTMCFVWTNLITFCLALVPVILLQVVWCCPLNKSGLITAGVLCSVVAAVAFLLGAIMLANRCITGDYIAYGDTIVCYYTYAGVLQLIGGGLMIGAAVCTFNFTCGPRYNKYHGGDDADPEPIVIAAVIQSKEQPGQQKKKSSHDSISQLSTGSGETKRITTLPDGSIKTETETVRPDGSRVVTTTIEKPNEEDDSSVDV